LIFVRDILLDGVVFIDISRRIVGDPEKGQLDSRTAILSPSGA
jgi:hypothetical protein